MRNGERKWLDGLRLAVLSMVLAAGLWGREPVYAQESPQAALVKTLYAAFGQGNIATILDALKDDVTWESVGPVTVCPCFGARKGKAAVGDFFKVGSERHKYNSFAPREMYTSGNAVIVLGSQELVIKATGRAFKSDWVHVFTIDNMKVSSFREFTDTAAYVDASR